MTTLPLTHFVTWLASGERGLSSEAMVSTFTGQKVGRSTFGPALDYPHDPDDFRRCERLLRQFPLARACLPMMRDVSLPWRRLVDAWDEIVALMESEIPGIFEGRPHYGARAPLSYKRMRELIDGERVTS